MELRRDVKATYIFLFKEQEVIFGIINILRGTTDGHGTIGVVWAWETYIHVKLLHYSTNCCTTSSDETAVDSGIDVDFNGKLVLLEETVFKYG